MFLCYSLRQWTRILLLIHQQILLSTFSVNIKGITINSSGIPKTFFLAFLNRVFKNKHFKCVKNIIADDRKTVSKVNVSTKEFLWLITR